MSASGPWTVYAVAYYDHSSQSLAVAVRRISQDRTVIQALGGKGWVDYKIGEWTAATVYLHAEQGKELAASLHSAGMIPDGELQSVAHRQALEFHLADMRRLLASQMGVQLPDRKT